MTRALATTSEVAAKEIVPPSCIILAAVTVARLLRIVLVSAARRSFAFGSLFATVAGILLVDYPMTLRLCVFLVVILTTGTA